MLYEFQVWFQNRRAKSRRQVGSSVSVKVNGAVNNSPAAPFPQLHHSRMAPEMQRMANFALRNSFGPPLRDGRDETHKTILPTKPCGFEQASVPCVYDASTERSRVKPEQIQDELSATGVSCNDNHYHKGNRHYLKVQQHQNGNSGPKQVLVEYDNFPPNKTIGPEMKVVIPPIPNQNNYGTMSPKKCHVQCHQMTVKPHNVGQLSPVHARAQEFSDSDSEWETGSMVGFGGFI